MPHDIPRREALIGLGVLGAVALTACGQSADNDASEPSRLRERPNRSGASSTPTTALASLRDIPVGSSIGVNNPDGRPVILSRLSGGKVAGFSAVCTHQGCTVQPNGTRLICPCHGSIFDATSGDVLSGPAQRALPAYDVTVVRGQVRPA